MHVQTINNWAEFDALEQGWKALEEAASSFSPFLTWEWIRSWRRAIDDAVEPYVVVVRRENGDIVGIAPLYRASLRLLRITGFRVLRFMADVATGSEYPDWLAHPEHEQRTCQAIAMHLQACRDDWDAIWLSAMSGWNGAGNRVGLMAEQCGLSVRKRDRGFAQIALPPSLEEYEGRLSARSRQQLRRNSRKFCDMDDVDIVGCDSPEKLPEFLEALFELHQLRWRTTGMDGAFRRLPVAEDFYRDFAPVALEKGWLWLYALRQGTSIKAVQFAIVHDGCYYQLQEGYDPSFKSGAGNALRHHVIEQCIQEGVETYDFLVGVTEHKRRWCVDVYNGFDMLIGNANLRSRVLFASGAWPTGRFIEEHGVVTGNPA